jgi:hypothetical protein
MNGRMKRWTAEEVERLKALYEEGKSESEISLLMNRTESSIANAIQYRIRGGPVHRERHSLRLTDEECQRQRLPTTRVKNCAHGIPLDELVECEKCNVAIEELEPELVYVPSNDTREVVSESGI